MSAAPSIDVEKMRAAIRAAKVGGLSYRQISIGAGMAPEWARQFVNGRSESPRIDTAMGLAATLNLPINAFYAHSPAPVAHAAPIDRVSTVPLQVVLPSEDILAEALQAALLATGQPVGEAGSLARELAALFPGALQGALYRAAQRRPPSAPERRAPSPQATDSK